MKTKEEIIAEIRELSQKAQTPESDYIDAANWNFALGKIYLAQKVISVIDEQEEENQSLRDKLDRAANLCAAQLQYEWDKKAKLEEKLEIAKKRLQILLNSNFDEGWKLIEGQTPTEFVKEILNILI